MSITERSREHVRELGERLREEYGEFETVEKTWRHPPGFYEELVERFEEGYAGGAGAWVYDEDGRVLLVKDRGGTGWSDPGGKRQPGESFVETAHRAVRESTGVDVDVTGVLELHEIEVYDGTDPDRSALYEPIVVFEAQYAGGTIDPGEEVDDVDWFDEHPPLTQYEDVERRSIPFEP